MVSKVRVDLLEIRSTLQTTARTCQNNNATMSGADGGVGYAGSNFSHFDYPGVWSAEQFHYCGLAPMNQIVSPQGWDNEQIVWTCMLDNLAE